MDFEYEKMRDYADFCDGQYTVIIDTVQHDVLREQSEWQLIPEARICRKHLRPRFPDQSGSG